MNRPPCQLAMRAIVPEKRSIVASTLGPGVLGVCVADHEIIRWVTSSGDQLPLIVQIVLGCVASVTSARTLVVEFCITSTASWAAGEPVQLDDIVAHAGTETALGVGVGEGNGLGLDDADAEALADEEREDDGLILTAALLLPHAPTTMTAASAANTALGLTGNTNGLDRVGVTGRPRDTGRTRIIKRRASAASAD